MGGSTKELNCKKFLVRLRKRTQFVRTDALRNLSRYSLQRKMRHPYASCDGLGKGYAKHCQWAQTSFGSKGVSYSCLRKKLSEDFFIKLDKEATSKNPNLASEAKFHWNNNFISTNFAWVLIVELFQLLIFAKSIIKIEYLKRWSLSYNLSWAGSSLSTR